MCKGTEFVDLCNKALVHSKMKILSSFTHHQVVPNLFVLLSIKEDILENVGNLTVDGSH